MTSGLAWLNELMLWLGRWFPRIVLVKRGYGAVWFGPGGRVQSLPAGLHWYWPIISELTVVSLLERSSEVATQLHGREVISIGIFYRIADPKTLLLSQNDLFSILDDRAQAALAMSYAVDSSNSAICESIQGLLQREFEPHGVCISLVRLLQRGRVIPIKNLSDWANHAKTEL